MAERSLHPDEVADPSIDSGQALRQRAEEKAGADAANARETLSPEAAGQVLHELRVHQIELEMQNEELRRTQVDLEALRARYFDLYDLAPVGYLIVNERGLIVEANLTAATLFGVARGDLVIQPLTRFILPEDQDIYYRHRRLLFETSAPQVYELRLVKKNASQFQARMEATLAQTGESGGAVCRLVVSDVTEQRTLQEALAQAQRIQAVGQFAIGVMHNFGNLLFAGSAYIDTVGVDLQQPWTDATAEACQHSLAQLRKVIESGRGLTRNLMTFCREQPARKELLNLPMLVATMTPVLKTTLGKEIALRVTQETATSPIIGDRSLIEQVILNLALNGRDAMPEGGTLTIATSEASLGSEAVARNSGLVADRYVRLRVSDTGVGMNDETRRRLFEPFFTTKPLGQGNGLGLPIVYGIISQLDGHIKVHSQPGQGATFDVFLPMA